MKSQYDMVGTGWIRSEQTYFSFKKRSNKNTRNKGASKRHKTLIFSSTQFEADVLGGDSEQNNSIQRYHDWTACILVENMLKSSK